MSNLRLQERQERSKLKPRRGSPHEPETGSFGLPPSRPTSAHRQNRPLPSLQVQSGGSASSAHATDEDEDMHGYPRGSGSGSSGGRVHFGDPMAEFSPQVSTIASGSGRSPQTSPSNFHSYAYASNPQQQLRPTQPQDFAWENASTSTTPKVSSSQLGPGQVAAGGRRISAPNALASVVESRRGGLQEMDMDNKELAKGAAELEQDSNASGATTGVQPQTSSGRDSARTSKSGRMAAGLVKCDIDFTNLFETIEELWQGMQELRENQEQHDNRISAREAMHQEVLRDLQETVRQAAFIESNMKSYRADFNMFSVDIKDTIEVINSRLGTLVDVPTTISRMENQIGETTDTTKEAYKLGLSNQHELANLREDLVAQGRGATAKFRELEQVQQLCATHTKQLLELESDLASRARAEEKADRREVEELRKRLQTLEIFMQSKASQRELEALASLPNRVDAIDSRAEEQRRVIERLETEILNLRQEAKQSQQERAELAERLAHQQSKHEALVAENRLLRLEMLELEERRRMLQQIVDATLGVNYSGEPSSLGSPVRVPESQVNATDAESQLVSENNDATTNVPSPQSELDAKSASGDQDATDHPSTTALPQPTQHDFSMSMSPHPMMSLSNIRLAPTIPSLTQAVELLIRDKADATALHMLEVKTRLMDGDARRLALTLRGAAARIAHILQTIVTLVLPSSAAVIRRGITASAASGTKSNAPLMTQTQTQTQSTPQRGATGPEGLTGTSLAAALAGNVGALAQAIESMLNVVETGTRWARARLKQQRQDRKLRRRQREEQRILLLQSGMTADAIDAALAAEEEEDDDEDASAEIEDLLYNHGASSESFPIPPLEGHYSSKSARAHGQKSSKRSKQGSNQSSRGKESQPQTATSDTEDDPHTRAESDSERDDDNDEDDLMSHPVDSTSSRSAKEVGKSKLFARFATREFVSEQIATMTAALTAFMSATRKEFQHIATSIALNSAASAAALERENLAKHTTLPLALPSSSPSIPSGSNGALINPFAPSLTLTGTPVTMNCASCGKRLEGSIGASSQGVNASTATPHCAACALPNNSPQETKPMKRLATNPRPRTAVPFARSQRAAQNQPQSHSQAGGSQVSSNLLNPELNFQGQPKTGAEALRALRSLAQQLEARADAYEMETMQELKDPEARRESLGEAAAAHASTQRVRPLSAFPRMSPTSVLGLSQGIETVTKGNESQKYTLETLSPSLVIGGQRVSLYDSSHLSPTLQTSSSQGQSKSGFATRRVVQQDPQFSASTQPLDNSSQLLSSLRLGPAPSQASIVKHRVPAVRDSTDQLEKPQLVIVSREASEAIKSGTRPSTAIGLKPKVPPKSLVTY